MASACSGIKSASIWLPSAAILPTAVLSVCGVIILDFDHAQAALGRDLLELGRGDRGHNHCSGISAAKDFLPWRRGVIDDAIDIDSRPGTTSR